MMDKSKILNLSTGTSQRVIFSHGAVFGVVVATGIICIDKFRSLNGPSLPH